MYRALDSAQAATGGGDMRARAEGHAARSEVLLARVSQLSQYTPSVDELEYLEDELARGEQHIRNFAHELSAHGVVIVDLRSGATSVDSRRSDTIQQAAAHAAMAAMTYDRAAAALRVVKAA